MKVVRRARRQRPRNSIAPALDHDLIKKVTVGYVIEDYLKIYRPSIELAGGGPRDTAGTDQSPRFFGSFFIYKK